MLLENFLNHIQDDNLSEISFINDTIGVICERELGVCLHEGIFDMPVAKIKGYFKKIEDAKTPEQNISIAKSLKPIAKIPESKIKSIVYKAAEKLNIKASEIDRGRISIIKSLGLFSHGVSTVYNPLSWFAIIIVLIRCATSKSDFSESLDKVLDTIGESTRVGSSGSISDAMKLQGKLLLLAFPAGIGIGIATSIMATSGPAAVGGAALYAVIIIPLVISSLWSYVQFWYGVMTVSLD